MESKRVGRGGEGRGRKERCGKGEGEEKIGEGKFRSSGRCTLDLCWGLFSTFLGFQHVCWCTVHVCYPDLFS